MYERHPGRALHTLEDSRNPKGRQWAGILRIGLLLGPGLLLACSDQAWSARVQAGDLEIGITSEGTIGSLQDRRTGKEYLPPDVPAPLLSLRVDGEYLEPVASDMEREGEVLRLYYEDSLEARIRIGTRATHATFELESVSGPPDVELAVWGPYPTTIDETIGETVGVVRGEDFAIGIQALNAKTLGGYPWNENDAMPQLDIFESGDFSDLSEEGKRHVLYRVEAAKPDTFGSTLQAYTRNRDQERVIPNWGHDRYRAPPFADGGITGSRIALFGSRVEDALATVGEIEVAEELPHPMIDGKWGKQARSAVAAYVIMPFSESTIEGAVDVTLRAGLRYLYHPEPFETWGHFRLGPDFPSGVEGLQRVVAAAEARGVHVGVHTLSNFITTNDAYVTPEPDPRLARVGATTLTEGVSPTDRFIRIQEAGFFNQFDNNHLRAAVIGQEVIRYRTVSDSPPWTLLDVERGAFGTIPGAHSAGDTVGKLADHGYRVFLTDPDLGKEMAETLADLFNETGLRQISFDGLEGNRSTAMGNYGEILFAKAWYDALSDEVRGHYIADASRTSHFFWHIFSRMNWGEPWYAGFRESQTEYRLKNQAYFRRNMIPGMLGWFRMQPETSVEDIEWMLARSAAFDAGYAFVTSFEALEENGRSEEILERIGRWEEARMADAFSPDQKARMEDISNEFHLDEQREGGWILTQVYPHVFRLASRERQPGEPSHQVYAFENPGPAQPLPFMLTASGCAARGIQLELDGVGRFSFPVSLDAGETLVYRGGGEATVYSPQWWVQETLQVDDSTWRAEPGGHELLMNADLAGGEECGVRLELRPRGSPESVTR
jgi:hypothetical protein